MVRISKDIVVVARDQIFMSVVKPKQRLLASFTNTVIVFLFTISGKTVGIIL